jgi:hypothetical protein
MAILWGIRIIIKVHNLRWIKRNFRLCKHASESLEWKISTMTFGYWLREDLCENWINCRFCLSYLIKTKFNRLTYDNSLSIFIPTLPSWYENKCYLQSDAMLNNWRGGSSFLSHFFIVGWKETFLLKIRKSCVTWKRVWIEKEKEEEEVVQRT